MDTTRVLLLATVLYSLNAQTPERSLPRVGIFYNGWHAEGYYAINYVKEHGGIQYTIEDLIRGTDGINFHDIYENHGVDRGFSFYWHTKPEDDFYCIYRKRPEESVGHFPDCPNISETLERHARQLTEAGVDHIVFDATNVHIFNAHSDTINYRPFEVLVEEWKQQRDQGVTTPDVVIWFPIPDGVGANAWRVAMDNVYSNPDYDDMILRDQNTGKKVVHVVANGAVDEGIVWELENEYDVTVVYNWALQHRDNYENGQWTMMQPCLGPSNGYSTTVVGRDCPLTVTRNSPLGTMVPVARSYQLCHGSLPWCAAGTFHGLTFKKQMLTALTERPDYLFVTGWNELIAQPQANPYMNVRGHHSMGMFGKVTHTSAYTGGHREPLFVDLHGEEFSRDFEPNAYTGDEMYQLLKSCIRVFRSGAQTCSDAEEECSNIATSDVYTNVYSLTNPGNGDHILVHSVTEKDILVTGGWAEECVRFPPGDALFCQSNAQSDATMGPFIVFSIDGPNRKPIYRCLNANDRHFFSEYSDCEDRTTEYTIGYVSTVKTSETPRILHRCNRESDGQHFHSLDMECPPGSNQEAPLGYVR